MKQLFTVIIAGMLVVYPFLLYFGLGHLGAKKIAVILCVLFLARAFLMKGAGIELLRQLLPICILIVITSTLAFITLDDAYLRLNPSLISLVFFCNFMYSLKNPPTTVERLAMIQIPDLPELAKVYCRKVTKVWCSFFAFNAMVSLGTVLYNDLTIWTLYNGLISYILTGLVFAVEYYFRRKNIAAFDAQMAED
jgi:uncharacterized membrane protein